MTEKFWQQEKKNIDKNKDNTNLIIQQTMEDKKKLVPSKHPKALYADCLQGALYLKQWSQSDDLSVDDMSLLICRDRGCELTYCQATLSDPYERPFENCESHFKQFNDCILQEKRRYLQHDIESRTMQQQIEYMLLKRKEEKYKHILPENINKFPEEKLSENDLNRSMKM